jgi:4-alpha-glucanotransferase
MNPSDFEKIEEFFRQNRLSADLALYAFPKYIENVRSSIKDQEKKRGRSLTQDEIRQICDNFLNEPMLRQFIDLSKASREADMQSIAKRYDKSPGVVRDITIGVISNLVFTILLILLYAAAKDQAVSALEKLGVVESRPPVTRTQPTDQSSPR